MASVFKENMDYQANQNNKFLHFVDSNEQSFGGFGQGGGVLCFVFCLVIFNILSNFKSHCLETKIRVQGWIEELFFPDTSLILAKLISLYFVYALIKSWILLVCGPFKKKRNNLYKAIWKASSS